MDRPTLTQLRDQMATVISAHDQAMTQGKNVLAAIDAELNREPSLADISAMLNEIIARKPA